MPARALNVLMVAANLRIPGPTGGAVHQLELVRALTRKGHRIYLVAMKPEEYPHCPGLIYLPIPYVRRQVLAPVLTLAALLRCLLALMSYEIDVIHDRMYLLGGAGTIAGLLFGKRKVVQADGNWVESTDYAPLRCPPVRALIDLWISAVLKNADAIMAVSRALKRVLVEAYGVPPQKIKVVPNGVDVEKFNPKLRELYRAEKDSDEIRLVYVGEIAPWHGLDVVIECLPKVLRRFPNVKLIIVGGPAKELQYSRERHSYVEQLKRKVERLGLSDKVVFTGYVPHDEVPRILATCDIALCLFTKEGGRYSFGFSPLKLFEYMAMGLPVISTDVEWIREIVEEGRSGFLIPIENMRNPMSISEAFIPLLANSSLRESVGRAARRICETKYSWDTITTKIVYLYQSMN